MTDKQHAQALAERLEAYWFSRGFAVRAWVEEVEARKRRGETVKVWVVRSDMRNGQPVRRIGE